MCLKPCLMLVIALCVVPKKWYATSQQFRPLDKWATYTITRKPCKNADGKQGVCMFRWDCINMNGLMLSACVDGFLFGACCYIERNNTSLISEESITSSTAYQTDNYANLFNEIPHTKAAYLTSLDAFGNIEASPTVVNTYIQFLNFDNASLTALGETSFEDPEHQNSSEIHQVVGVSSSLIDSSVYETNTLTFYEATISKTPFLTSEQIFNNQSTAMSIVVTSPILNASGNSTLSCRSSDCFEFVLKISTPVNIEELFSSSIKSEEASPLLLSTPSVSDLMGNYTLQVSEDILFSFLTKDKIISIYTSNPTLVHSSNALTSSKVLEILPEEFVSLTTDFLFIYTQNIQVLTSSWPTEFYTMRSTTVLPFSKMPLLQNGLEQYLTRDSLSSAAYSIQTAQFPDSTYNIVKEDIVQPTSPSLAVESSSFYSGASLDIHSMEVNLTGSKWNYGEECGVKHLRPLGRIVGGKNTYFGKWPWQVLVKESAWLGIHVKNKCGGVLINSFYVLTAAHCQPGFLASLMVILGEHDLSSDQEELKPVKKDVKRMIVHREYNSHTLENDLALLELQSAVEFQPHIIPICLPERGEDFTDQMAYVTGWGKLSHGGTLPTVLQEVRVPIISNSRCQQMFLAAGHIKAIRDTFVCAGYDSGGQDSCEGDSGGPLMVQRPNERWVLVGTVSHGIRCADPNLPGVYMRTAAYRAWIDNIIKQKPKSVT